MNFCEKLSFGVFGPEGSQNRPKVRFFKFCEKSIHKTFMIFYVKFFYLNLAYRLKIDMNRLFQGKILFLGFWAKKGPKTWQK